MTGRAKSRKSLFSTAWEFRVPLRKRRAFEKAYGPEGTWAQLFRADEGYIRTELLRERGKPGRYVTIDYWKSRQDFVTFKKKKHSEYKALDKKCAALTRKENPLGEFESLEPR